MVVKFVKKYILEVVPSIIATVIGAYIVTHYINVKPDADKARTETAAPTVAGEKDVKKDLTKDAAKDSAKSGTVADKKSAAIEKPAGDKLTAEKPEKSEKPSDKSTETASVPSDTRRQPLMKDFLKNKTTKTSPATTSASAPAHEVAPEDNRDANEIARAAIERLRSGEAKETVKPVEVPNVQEAARMPESPRPVQERSRVNVGYAPQVVSPPSVQPTSVQPAAAPVVTPLPTVSIAPSPSDNAPSANAGFASPSHPSVNNARAEDRSRPTPPADIPSRPLDLRAAAAQDQTSVAEDVVSAAKSVFKAVVPQ